VNYMSSQKQISRTQPKEKKMDKELKKTNHTKTKNPKKVERELLIHVDAVTRDQAALAEGARP
jgi:hypothetical protein